MMHYIVWVSESLGTMGPGEPYIATHFADLAKAEDFCKAKNGPTSHAYVESIYDPYVIDIYE